MENIFGLKPATWYEYSVNHQATDGLKNARRLEELGYVTIQLLHKMWETPSRAEKWKLWTQYKVTPTQKGLSALSP